MLILLITNHNCIYLSLTLTHLSHIHIKYTESYLLRWLKRWNMVCLLTSGIDFSKDIIQSRLASGSLKAVKRKEINSCAHLVVEEVYSILYASCARACQSTRFTSANIKWPFYFFLIDIPDFCTLRAFWNRIGNLYRFLLHMKCTFSNQVVFQSLSSVPLSQMTLTRVRAPSESKFNNFSMIK